MRLYVGIVGLFVGILIVAGLVWMGLLFGAMGSTSKLPLGGGVATVNKDSRDQFLEDLKKFASEMDSFAQPRSFHPIMRMSP